MKNLKKHIMALLALAVALTFSSCANDSSSSSGNGTNNGNSESENTPVILPESKGENPFKGKSYIKVYDFEDDDPDGPTTWKFSENTIETTSGSESYSNTTIYNYTYDSENSLIYLSLKSYSFTENGKTYSCTNAEEHYSELLRVYKDNGMTPTGIEIEESKTSIKTNWNTIEIYKYETKGLKIKTTKYFNGEMPSNAGFYYYNFNDSVNISSSHGRLDIEFDYDDENNIEYTIYPTFNENSFSGTVYKYEKIKIGEHTDEDGYEQNDYERKYSKLSTLKGLYSTEGTGTSGCTLTIVITEAPEELSSLKGKEFVLEQN